MLYANALNRVHDYIYGNYGWVGVMFSLIVLAFVVTSSFIIWDRSK